MGVFVLAGLDSAGVPIVGGVDALLTVLAVVDPGAAYTAAGAAVLGSLAGSLILFAIARRGGEAYLGRYTSGGRGEKLKAWFLEYGLLTVFVPAVTPILPLPLKVFILSAGALGVNPVRFALALAAARIPRYFFLAWLGMRLGRRTLPFLKAHWWELLLFAALLFSALYWLLRRLDRKPAVAAGPGECRPG